jgi:hypothetical protein
MPWLATCSESARLDCYRATRHRSPNDHRAGGPRADSLVTETKKETMKLSQEKRDLIAQYPALAPFAEANDMNGLRNLARAIDTSVAAARPKAVKREPTTAELLAEAQRLAREVAELSAQRKPTVTEAKTHTGEAVSTYLDRTMNIGDQRPGATVRDVGAVQQFGVKGSR